MSSLRLALKQSLAEADPTLSGDGGSDNEEREASLHDLQDSSASNSETDDEQTKAATLLQNHYRKAKRPKKDYTVPPPHPDLIRFMRHNHTTIVQHLEKGLRVKVCFDNTHWYGGLIQKVNSKKTKMRIHYDDGSREQTKMGPDIVVDDTHNGQHENTEAALFFQTYRQEPSPTHTTGLSAAATTPTAAAAIQQPPPPKSTETLQQQFETKKKKKHEPTSPASPKSPKRSSHTSSTSNNNNNKPASPKHQTVASTTATSPPTSPPQDAPVKRKRGRPRKYPKVEPPTTPTTATTTTEPNNNNNNNVPVTIRMPDKKQPSLTIRIPTQPKSTAEATMASPKTSSKKHHKKKKKHLEEGESMMAEADVTTEPDPVRQESTEPPSLPDLTTTTKTVQESSSKHHLPTTEPVRLERKAAQQANERITAKPDSETPVKRKKKRRMEATPAADDGTKWIQCDSCKKWRIIPMHAVADLLPDAQWHCSDNLYDVKRNHCDAPEQSAEALAKAAKRRLKKRQRTEESEQQKMEAAGGPKSPRPLLAAAAQDNTGDKRSKRASPTVEDHLVPPSLDRPPKKEKKGTAVKRGRPAAATEPDDTEQPPVVKRSRGRPRRNPPKESATTAQEEEQQQQQEEGNVEWVQCEACNKWRKLAPHISADQLPDVWTCDMNTWNPDSASCDAPEDQADGLQDVGEFGKSGANKLSYRNLIFGNNGRKANRPVSERTRAAESLFSVQFDEDMTPPRVLYADSSAFLARHRNNNNTAEEESSELSLFDVLKDSQIWQELRGVPLTGGSQQRKLTSYTYDTLPESAKQPMKELMLHFLLNSGLHTGDDLVQLASSQHVPEQCVAALPYCCNKNVVVTTLYQLVQEGKVDCVHKQSQTSLSSRNHYRLSKPYRLSRCMKIAKPWKRGSL